MEYIMAQCPNCCSSNVLTMPGKAVAGATAGGLLGSVVPVIGTGLGAIVGATVGGIASLGSTKTYCHVCVDCKETWTTSADD